MATDSGGGLFAGLSMAPAGGSPSKALANDVKPTQTNGMTPSPTKPLSSGSNGTSNGSHPMPAREESHNSPAQVLPPSSPQATTSSPTPVASAPVTDKLLGLLTAAPAEAAVASSPSAGAIATNSNSNGNNINSNQSTSRGSATGEKGLGNAATSEPWKSPGTQQLGGGSQTKSLSMNGANKETADVLSAFSLDSPAPKSPLNSSKSGLGDGSSAANSSPQKPPKSAASQAPAHGAGIVHPETPIPNSDIALRLFRKFAHKTRPQVPESYGGTQKLSIMRFLFGSSTEQDRRFLPYSDLITLILEGRDGDIGNEDEKDESDRIVESVMGQSGDTMAKARKAVAKFCHLLSMWGHVSARLAESEKDTQGYKTLADIVSVALDTATALVTHGCLDGVMVGIGPNHSEYHKAVDILAQSVFSADLSLERNELAAMKFLLSTGCRVLPNGEAMLRGTHLLQTIRVLYHVHLTTAAEANRTTARASLQQLVTSVFIRMIASDAHNEPHNNQIDSLHNGELPTHTSQMSFPSEDHRDAFLVLRSLCRLSMRSPPPDPGMHSHVGLQTSGSNANWDSKDTMKNSSDQGGDDGSQSTQHESHREQPHHLYTQAIHPALESKILALDLLLYVLQNTQMKGSFLQNCGSQFHYAVRHYLCVSLLKNCTSDNTRVVSLSLRVFVPIIANFRSILKTEIEAFVTNVFFVILDSKNSPLEHKSLVVTLFEEICSDPTTLAEIFLNYDCDLSAVDLFHRIVNTLSKVSKITAIEDDTSSSISLVAGAGAARMEKLRIAHRKLRLDAMRALRQVLASLHASIVEPMKSASSGSSEKENSENQEEENDTQNSETDHSSSDTGKQTLVQIYDSKKKRREEESEVVLRFNQKPSAGISYASKCNHLDGSDAGEVARWLLKNKDILEKTQIGEYLGREAEYQNGFCMKVLHEYVNSMDFSGLLFDDAIRFYLSGFRLPGEAQKIDRIMEKFAERYTAQNPDVFPTADVAFILAFSIIMLNTDLHNPAIKEERRMTKPGFIRNNRGICDGQDLPEELLISIFDRIKLNPISLKEDDEARERAGESKGASNTSSTTLPSALSPAVFFTSHYEEMDRTKETNFNKERDQIVRTTESLLKRRRHHPSSDNVKNQRRPRANSHGGRHSVRYVRTEDSGLRDEYVSPMFEVTWGPALAAFSTAMESANGTIGALPTIASDEELELAAENAAETIEVCLTGFRFAVCTAGLCGNETARDAYMLALSRFSQLGTGILLEPRHVRCIQTLLNLARYDGELLGSSWEHVFKALSEINRFHQLFQLMARNDRVAAAAAQRRQAKLRAQEQKNKERAQRRAARENSDSLDDASTTSVGALSDGESSFADSELFSDDDDFLFDDELDKKAIDEANARTVYGAVSEGLIEAIYERSSSLSTAAVKEFVLQLCRVSRMEISHYGGHVGSNANTVDLTQVHYRQHHTLLLQSPSKDSEGFHHHQPNIYNLQKLVEVTHYNMESRPRLVFADLWTTVAAHLTSTALHSNSAVAMYAVDSFRQLCIQFLQRDELGVFEFQRRFLKPLESVMARSDLVTTKELLLKCVERIILMFGSAGDDKNRHGLLRSGWRPVLTVLGLAGKDPDEGIAKLGFSMLCGQLEQCLPAPDEDARDIRPRQGVLLAERFIDLVDALLMYIAGPHEEMGLVALDKLVALSAYLGDDSFELPLIKTRTTSSNGAIESEAAASADAGGNEDLELWWPILLGISKTVGDARKRVQVKSLEALLKIVTTHFFPSPKNMPASGKDGDIQTLQLIFRGILTPVLEFGEVETQDARVPQLPDDFERFVSSSKSAEAKSPVNTKSYWLDTMFDQFMDGCVSLCLRSMDAFDDDTLVEEIFAILNSCLVSDSGALAVRGLRRLEQFVTSDLKRDAITDDTWATVSHMLRRCLTLRGLPKSSSTSSLNGSSESARNEDDTDLPSGDNLEAIREFITEDNVLTDKRYVGSNAVMVIGSFLDSERFLDTLGLRWRLFLVSGVGRAIRDWERAADILSKHGIGKSKPRGQNPPHYLESAQYGRKWMNRFLLQLASMKEVAQPAKDGSRQAAAHSLIKEQTQSLVTAFLEKEAALSKEGKKSSLDSIIFNKLISLVKDMLAGYSKLPDEHLHLMAWLNPVLSSCIHTSNGPIRLAIQKLVKRLH